MRSERKRRPIRSREVEIRTASPSGECYTRPMTEEERVRYGMAEQGGILEKGGSIMAYRKYTHVTKQFVEAEFAQDKGAAQIEQEQGMPRNSLFVRLKEWGIRSPNSPSPNQNPMQENPASGVKEIVLSPPKKPVIYPRLATEKLEAAAELVGYAQEKGYGEDVLLAAIELLLFLAKGRELPNGTA